MKFHVLGSENVSVGELELSDDVFCVLPRKDILSRVVLWQLSKRRSGTHAVKGKSDVHGTTRKMYRQKGTGGARHGSRKAVQFRGGGVVFGPVLRDHSLSLPKKIRKLGLKMALSDKVRNGSLLIVDSLHHVDFMKTADFVRRFKEVGSALFIDSLHSDSVARALSNVVGFDFLPQIGLNVYDIIKKDKLIMSVNAVQDLERRLI